MNDTLESSRVSTNPWHGHSPSLSLPVLPNHSRYCSMLYTLLSHTTLRGNSTYALKCTREGNASCRSVFISKALSMARHRALPPQTRGHIAFPWDAGGVAPCTRCFHVAVAAVLRFTLRWTAVGVTSHRRQSVCVSRDIWEVRSDVSTWYLRNTGFSGVTLRCTARSNEA